MSRPKGGRSVQLRGTAFESERSRHFPYNYGPILKWGVSVVLIGKALRWLSRVCVITYGAGDNSKRVGWWIGVEVTSPTCRRLGGVDVSSNLGHTLAACGGGKNLCVRPVYGLWCAHSFNKPSPSVRQR